MKREEKPEWSSFRFGGETSGQRGGETKRGRETHCKLRTKGGEKGESRNRKDQKIISQQGTLKENRLGKKTGEKRGERTQLQKQEVGVSNI